MLLCLNRGLHKAYNRVREGNFTLNGLTGFEIRGKVVGIIGTGKIGTITAQIFCRGFGARLLAYDAYPNADITAMGGEYVSLETLLEQSDIISLHCPLSKSTFHLIASEQIARMKRGVMLINTSRGGLLDTRAVIAGLESGAIGGLCIDVYENEGPLFFRDFSALNRGQRMKNWDEQMGVRCFVCERRCCAVLMPRSNAAAAFASERSCDTPQRLPDQRGARQHRINHHREHQCVCAWRSARERRAAAFVNLPFCNHSSLRAHSLFVCTASKREVARPASFVPRRPFARRLLTWQRVTASSLLPPWRQDGGR